MFYSIGPRSPARKAPDPAVRSSKIPVKKPRAPLPPKSNGGPDTDKEVLKSGPRTSKVDISFSESSSDAKKAVKKALFLSDPDLTTNGASRNPSHAILAKAFQAKPSKISRPVIESVPITVNSHIPASGSQIPVAFIKKTSTIETGTQMDECAAKTEIADIKITDGLLRFNHDPTSEHKTEESDSGRSSSKGNAKGKSNFRKARPF